MEVFLHPVIDSCQSDGELFVGRYQPMTVGQLKNHIQSSVSETYSKQNTSYNCHKLIKASKI